MAPCSPDATSPRTRHARTLLLPIVLCLAVPGLAPAQQAGEPRTRLVDLLPDDLRGKGEALVAEPDPAMRARLVRELPRVPAVVPFLAVLGESDPAPAVRIGVIRAFSAPPYRAWTSGNEAIAGDARGMALLRRLATEDPSVEVSLAAIEALRVTHVAAITPLIDARLARARAAGDTGALEQLREQGERYIALRSGTMLPSFLRRIPPPWSVTTTSSVRVVAFGDFGTGLVGQRSTADAIARYHQSAPFDFGLTLGDNFYPIGMLSTDDPRWRTWWEDIYAPLGIAFYATLGNHDWGHPDSPASEILYSGLSETWRMPAPYYTFSAGPVQFFAIDNNEMSERQLAWLDEAIASSSATWKVVYGHIHIYSATRGDNPTLIERLVPLLNDRVDVYLNGHDHNLQALQPERGVHYFIAGGGGAGTYAVKDYERSIVKVEGYGFAVVEADAHRLTVRLVDADLRELYKKEIVK